jgi:hypothetical protein
MFWRKSKPKSLTLPSPPPYTSGWTSVKDYLPDDEREVWVLNLVELSRYDQRTEMKLLICNGKFRNSYGWLLKGHNPANVKYWTYLDYTGINLEDCKYICEGDK